MRLICPNCGAQYEVSDDVIPEQGRDVQCSNCGHTWFERPGASVAAEPEMPSFGPVEDPAPADPETTPDTKPQSPPEPETEPESQPSIAEMLAEPEPTETPDAPVAADEPATEEDVQPSPPPAAPKRQPIDDSIAAILKEEAAREEATRAAEAQSGLERQGDLGVDDIPTMTDTKKAESADRIARIKGEETPPDVASAVATTVAASRREMLPDIDDINASLRSDSERETPPPTPEEEEIAEKRGFRFGFFSVLMIFVVLILVYLFADRISAAVPAVEGALDAYVAAVDSLRLWFDAQANKLLVMLEGPEA